MKLMFISDIHGSYYYLNKALEAYYNEKPDKLILLGDLIIAVRGNCDAEVDQMVLDFPMMADYATIDVDGHHFFLSHGHLFNEENLPNLNEGDIFVYGHIHRPVAKCENGIYIINPSSISLPKEGRNSYGIYEDDKFIIKEFDNTIVKEIIIK